MLDPLVGAGAVRNLGVEVVFLHELQSLRCAKIVTRASEADVANGVKRESFVVDFNTANRALDRANDVVVNEQTFQRKAEQTSQHTCRFINQVGTRVTNERVVVGFFETGLAVGHFGVAHARGGCSG